MCNQGLNNTDLYLFFFKKNNYYVGFHTLQGKVCLYFKFFGRRTSGDLTSQFPSAYYARPISKCQNIFYVHSSIGWISFFVWPSFVGSGYIFKGATQVEIFSYSRYLMRWPVRPTGCTDLQDQLTGQYLFWSQALWLYAFGKEQAR